MNLFNVGPRINPKDAPRGYYAVLKSEGKPEDGSNICRACDWRSYCPSGPINEMPCGHNCRGYDLVGGDGKIYVRADRCNVLFKRIGVST